MQTAGGSYPPLPPPGRVDLEGALESAQPKVERILVASRIPAEDAEDLLHDALTELIVRGEAIVDPEAWLIAQVKWATLYYWRARRRGVVDQLDEAIAEQLAESDGRGGEEGLSLTHDLERQLRTLPTRCRRLLRMRYGLGFEPCEVAEEMGYQAESVRKVTRRCLDSLAVRLARGGYGGEEIGVYG